MGASSACSLHVCKPWTCSASGLKKEPGVSHRDISGLMGGGSLPVGSKVLKGQPTACGGLRVCHDGWGTAAIFAPSERGRIQVIRGTNLRLTRWLPGKLVEGHAPHHPFAGYPPGYPMQAYVDPSNPNAGKVLLPTPSMDPVCSPAAYDHSQPLVGHSTEPLAAPPPVPVVPHVAAPVEVSSSQYVAQSDAVVHQDSSVTVLPVPAPGPVQGQNYSVWDSNQQSVSVQQQYSPAQSQTTIYYQGQACPTVYGVTSPYSQTTPPIVQVTNFGNPLFSKSDEGGCPVFEHF